MGAGYNTRKVVTFNILDSAYNTLGSIFFWKNFDFFFKILQKVNLQKWSIRH